MVTLKKILVPTDFSALSVPAIGYALSLAKDHAAEVIVLHAVPTEATKERFSDGFAPGGLAAPTEAPIGTARQPDVDSLLERKKRIVGSFLEEKISPDLLRAISVRILIKVGKVTEEILAVAKEEQCDLIVMTREVTGLRRLMQGSFTDRVLQRAICPVLSIQPEAEIRTEENKRVPVKSIDQWAA